MFYNVLLAITRIVCAFSRQSTYMIGKISIDSISYPELDRHMYKSFFYFQDCPSLTRSLVSYFMCSFQSWIKGCDFAFCIFKTVFVKIKITEFSYLFIYILLILSESKKYWQHDFFFCTPPLLKRYRFCHSHTNIYIYSFGIVRVVVFFFPKFPNDFSGTRPWIG